MKPGIIFNFWVKLIYGEQNPLYYNFPEMFMYQIEWIGDDQEKILVNTVIRFENLESVLIHVCRDIGVEAS